MAKGDKYTWTFTGRQRTWDFAIQKEGFTTTATGMLAGAEAFLTWGQPSNELNSTLLPCDLKVEVIDPNLTLYNELIDDDLEEDDFRLVATDSTGTYTIRLRVRLDTVETYLVPGIEEQVTSLYAYCGLSELKNIDALTLTSASIHRIFRDILSLQLVSQDIEYLAGIYPTNLHTSGAVLDLVRLNRLDLIYAEEGRKIDTMQDQLQGMVDGWGLTAFNGMDGQWHVKHRWGLGETITSGRGKQKYTLASNTLATLATLSQSTITLSKPIIHRSTTRRILKPVQAIEITRGTNREFITVDLIKHGDFETGWTSGTAHEVWTVNNGSIARSTKSDTGTYAMRIDDGNSSVQQNIGYFAASSQIHLQVALRHAMEDTVSPGGAPNDSMTWSLWFDPIDSNVILSYTAKAGEWSQDVIANSFTISDTPEANGTGTLTYETYTQTISAVMPPVDGLLYIIFIGDTNNDYYCYIDNLEVRLLDTSDASVSKYRSVFPRVLSALNLFGDAIATRGEIVRQARAWFNGVVGVDTDGDGTRDELHKLLEVDSDGAGTWVQASQFTNEGYLYPDTYDDLAKATADAREGEQDAPLQVIDGEVLGIVSPASPVVYSGKTYIPVYARVDLKREVTRFTGVEKRKTFVVNNAAPDTLYFLDSSRRVRSAPISLTATGWSTATLFTVTSRTTTRNLRVDQAAGYIFVGQQTGGVYYVRRHDMDGSNATDVWTSTTESNMFFDIDRSNGYLVLVTDDTSNLVRRYNYDGTLVDSFTATAATSVGPIALSEDQSYAVYITRSSGTNTLRKMVFSTSTESSLGTAFTGASSAGAEMRADDGYGRIFHRSIDASSEYIAWVATSGGSKTDLTTLDGQNGLSIDRANQLLYWGDDTDVIKEFDYDGASTRTVIDVSIDTFDIVSIDLGV